MFTSIFLEKVIILLRSPLLQPLFGRKLQVIHNILFSPTIGRKYFVKTQTIVALFGPHELSLIFLGGMGLEVTSL